MYLVDTNVMSELRKGERCAVKVARWYAEVPDQDLFTSVLVLGEVQRGVATLQSRDPAQAKALTDWLGAMTRNFHERIVPVDLPVALEWGQLNARRTYPIIDALLAATAIAHDFVLVTRNVDDIGGSGVRYLNPFVDRRIRLAN